MLRTVYDSRGSGDGYVSFEVFQTSCAAGSARSQGIPELAVLDSTEPAQIERTFGAVNLARTIFIVSSKSGTTLEPNILFDYAFKRVTDVIGAENAPARFVAILIRDPHCSSSPYGAASAMWGWGARISVADTQRWRIYD